MYIYIYIYTHTYTIYIYNISMYTYMYLLITRALGWERARRVLLRLCLFVELIIIVLIYRWYLLCAVIVLV